jgi:putative ABC transport system permease protein
VLLISLRDLQWRLRRFVISVLATGLAFGLSLVMTGVIAHLHNESERTVALYDADHWLVADGASGPFTASTYLSADLAAAYPDAAPLLLARTTIGDVDVNVIGYTADSIAQPSLLDGVDTQAPAPGGTTPGIVVASELDEGVGDVISFGDRSYTVTAEVDDSTFYFATPTVFLPIGEVQDAFFAGEPVASTVLVDGDLGTVPAGVRSLTSADVRDDLDRTVAKTGETIDVINALLWVMAAGIVAAMVYISTLERTRDFAVLKAVGSRTRTLTGGLIVQSALLTLAGAAVSVGVAAAISPSFAFAVEVPASAYVQLVTVALIVGTVASLAGIRRISRIDPALAFGGR